MIGKSSGRALLDPIQKLGRSVDSAAISLWVGRKISAGLAGWIGNSLAEGGVARDVNVHVCESKTSMISSTFKGAHLSKVTFPLLDARDIGTAYYNVTLALPSVVTRKGACNETLHGAGSIVPLKRRDFTVENTIGIPHSVGWVRVSAITWKQVPIVKSNTSTSRTGSTGVGWRSSISQVSFFCHGNTDDTKAVWDMFEKITRGNMMNGSITINLVDPSMGYETFASIKLSGLRLDHYNPGIQADVNQPSTQLFSFTVVPGSVEFTAK